MLGKQTLVFDARQRHNPLEPRLGLIVRDNGASVEVQVSATWEDVHHIGAAPTKVVVVPVVRAAKDAPPASSFCTDPDRSIEKQAALFRECLGVLGRIPVERGEFVKVPADSKTGK
jgi:hypothetical protein